MGSSDEVSDGERDDRGVDVTDPDLGAMQTVLLHIAQFLGTFVASALLGFLFVCGILIPVAAEFLVGKVLDGVAGTLVGQLLSAALMVPIGIAGVAVGVPLFFAAGSSGWSAITFPVGVTLGIRYACIWVLTVDPVEIDEGIWWFYGSMFTMVKWFFIIGIAGVAIHTTHYELTGGERSRRIREGNPYYPVDDEED